MWVFCCGMYRSASTLQFQVTSELVKDACVGLQVGWIDANRFDEVREQYRNTYRLKVVKVHKCTEPIRSEFLQENAIGLYSYRDVRDVYASMMKQRQKSFEFLWDEGFLDDCLDNFKHWTTLKNVMVSRYQDILDYPAKEVKRIADHLGISITLDECRKIAENYAIAAQKKRMESFKAKLLTLARSPNDHRELVDYHDETNLLHMNHIDAVKTGRWKDDLNVHEVALIENRVNTWCKANHYEPTIFLS